MKRYVCVDCGKQKRAHNKFTNRCRRDRPDLAEWWAQQEERIGGTFRNDWPSYRAMLAQPDLFKDTQTDDIIECFCHD